MIDHQSQHVRSYSYQVMNGAKNLLRGSSFVTRHLDLLSSGCMIDSACVISGFVINGGLSEGFDNDHDKLCCYKFDPFISPECCLIPNNMGVDLFMRIAPFNPKRGVIEELLLNIIYHGEMCHMTGANLCIAVSSLKDMFLSCGVSNSIGNSMINYFRMWLVTNLVRSGSKKYKYLDLEDYNMDETTAFAGVVWLTCKCLTYGATFLTGRSSDDAERKSVVASLYSVIHLLLGKCISHWYKNGGIAFCMYKMVYILSTAKAVILSLSDGLSSEPNAVEAEKQYISCFFEFVCAGCMYEQTDSAKNDNTTKLSSCRKKIIQCCSSNRIMPDLVRRVLSHGEEPYKLMERALDDCCDVSDVKCFVGVKEEVVSKVMSISKGVFYNYAICCSVDGCSSESNARSLTVSLELARVKAESEKYFMYRCRDYNSYLLYGWIDCINEGADVIVLRDYKIMKFINYLVETCHYDVSEFKLSEIVSSIEAKVLLCYSTRKDQDLVDSLMDTIGSLMKICIVESEIKIFSVFRWLRISISQGCGIINDRYSCYDERFLRRKFNMYYSCMGMVLLPNEVSRQK